MLILWGRGLLPIFNLNEQNFQTQKGRVKNDFSFFTRPFLRFHLVGSYGEDLVSLPPWKTGKMQKNL
jgi:hypothetical protein